jgi:LemA protein
MKTRLIPLILIAIVSLSLGSCGYNKLVTTDEACNAQWAQVENVYQRRADLIPNIVATVKGEANFEQETLTKVMEARASATQVKIDPSNMTDEDIKRFEDAQYTFGGTISRLMSVAESYPTLQANKAFADLRVELEGSENRITIERKKFIEAVQTYNTLRRRFPTNITASLFGFSKRATFTSKPGSDTAPTVDFSK